MSLLLDKTRDEARRNKKIQQGFMPEESADSPDARAAISFLHHSMPLTAELLLTGHQAWEEQAGKTEHASIFADSFAQHLWFLYAVAVIQLDAMKKTDPIREHIANLLTKAEAHVDLREALKNFPRELRGRKPDGSPHTPWQLLEHIRIAQWDILEFSRSAKHKSPTWPDEYWPKTEAPPSDKAWDASVKQVLADLDAVRKFISDPKRDLTAKIPHGDGQTLLREALLVADHNAYHLGQLVMVRRILERK